MALDASEHGQINKYYRVLYFTHTAHDVGGSDTANRCLQPGMDYESCINYLRSDYVVLMHDPNTFRSRGLGWRIHGSVEDTKLSTNKQRSL